MIFDTVTNISFIKSKENLKILIGLNGNEAICYRLTVCYQIEFTQLG